MARSILIPCGGCGYENFPQHRFCGMCGFPLPETSSGNARPLKSAGQTSVGLDEFMAPVSSDDHVAAQSSSGRSETATQRNAAPPQTLPVRNADFEHPVATRSEPQSSGAVSGPSFLGLAAEPNSDRERASYLLEDEQSSSHPGRFVLVMLLLIAVALGAAVWHWRQEVGALGARISGRSSRTTLQPADASTSPTDGSQATPPGANAPQPGSDGAVNTTPATAQSGPTPSTINSSASTAPAQPANAATLAPVPDQTTVTSEPSTPPANDQTSAAAPQADDGSSAEKTMRQEDAAKAARAARKANLAPVNASASAANVADSGEAEGEKYLYGTGVPQNCDRAQKSLLAAAGRADAKAQSVLGTMYATGHCAPRDLPLAYKWFAKALHQDPNNDRLSQDLKVLWNQMTPDERQLAQHNE